MKRLFVLVVALLATAGVFYGCTENPAGPSAATTNAQAKVDLSKLARTTTVSIPKVGQISPAVLFWGPMPTGVAVSRDMRIFMCFPRWGDHVDFTCAEIKNGQAAAYPNPAMNQADANDATDHLISVQSVVIDPKNRLWILDTGSINFGPTRPGGAKLLRADLVHNKIVQRIVFPPDVALKTSYLNDVRFDLKRGKQGMAYITDSSSSGPNGIIVVDLASGQSWRRLNDQPSTKADPNFIPTVEGEPLMMRQPGQPESALKMGTDGIAIDPAKGVLYFCPLASRRIYSVSLDALSDPNATEAQVVKTVQELPPRDFASDGLLCDAHGRLFLTDYEHNAIRRLKQDGTYEIAAADPTMIWPDSMSLGRDGYLYFTCNQLDRMPRFHGGQELRKFPYVLFRTPVDAKPVTMQ